MPKKKNYQAPRAEKSPADSGSQPPQTLESNRFGTKGTRTAADADIDLVELLGPDARFAGNSRTIILSHALGRCIDEWVFASADAIRKRLLAGSATETCQGQRNSMLAFFEFLTVGATSEGLTPSRPATPGNLKPLHIAEFIAWLKKREIAQGEAKSTTRITYSRVKSTLLVMFDLGFIKGESHRFFKRGAFGSDGESSTTSLSDAEQERLARAIKSDLSAIHHGRLEVSMRELQALRLLVVAHRMGHNTTPLLELTRNAMKPGLLPGTVLVETVKHRGKKVTMQMGLASSASAVSDAALKASVTSSIEDGKNVEVGEDTSSSLDQEYLPFSLAEGAVICQAVAATEHLVAKAPKRLQDRVWLYEVPRNMGGKTRKGDVTALTGGTLITSIKALVKRHELAGDDGKRLVVNISRLRKSRFDRAFRIADGDLAVTANLMGNTPQVAGVNYPSMNAARQAEAAGFMNEDYIGMMLGSGQSTVRVIEIKPVDEVQTPTPVAGCSDALGGEHAPKNGNLCARFVMCLFCSSFAIVGTVDELWRLFSFQAFARVELAYLKERLGPEPEGDERIANLQDLRDRYRLAIQYIDSFTQKQFAASRVQQARAKTAAGLHPFWVAQMGFSRRARSAGLSSTDLSSATGDQGINKQGDGRYGT